MASQDLPPMFSIVEKKKKKTFSTQAGSLTEDPNLDYKSKGKP